MTYNNSVTPVTPVTVVEPTTETTVVPDADIQHGIDDNPVGDGEKGAKLGAIGGAVTGAAAGSMTGPVGAVVGAVVGAIAGGVGSGAAVAAVDRHDNDNNISGVGDGVTLKDSEQGPSGERLGDSVTVDTASGTTVVNG
jgi:hypothetical protein